MFSSVSIFPPFIHSLPILCSLTWLSFICNCLANSNPPPIQPHTSLLYMGLCVNYMCSFRPQLVCLEVPSCVHTSLALLLLTADFAKLHYSPGFHLHCSPCILPQRKWSYPALISRLSPTTFINLHDFLPAFSSLGRREDSPVKANPSTCAPNPKIFHRWFQPCSCAIIPSHSHIYHFPLVHVFFPQAYVYDCVSPL